MILHSPVSIKRGKRMGRHLLSALLQRPLHLPIEGTAALAEPPWQTSRILDHSIRLQQKPDGLHLHLSRPRTEPFYIVQNGQPESFRKLHFAEGINIRPFKALCLGSFGENDPTLSCALVVLEFDRNHERIGSVVIPLNATEMYHPSPEAWRILFCLRFKGSGHCAIHGLRMEALEEHTPQPASSSVALPDGLAEQAVFISYTEAKKQIAQAVEQATQGFSAEAYKWKRRALDWERQYRSTEGGQIGNLTHETLIELAKSLPVSNGSRLQQKIPLKLGIITDVYMFNFYKDVFEEVHYLSPDNYADLLEQVSFDLILYVTCWKGMQGEDWRGVTFRDKPARALESILDHARGHGIKTVFQSIEDPSNFEYFLPIAQKFDAVFTSDTEMIPRYQAECGHDRIFYGEYGANPLLHNPIGCRRHRINAAFFAGSCPKRYPERCADMEILFDSILNSSGRLVIADRNYDADSEELRFPERFQGCIMPPVRHDLLQAMHKLFRYNLNFNSIKNSPSMCAMRVYELQAMGAGMMSNYARSVFNCFPDIRIVPWAQNLQGDFDPAEDFAEYRRNMAMLRNVLTDKTSHDIARRMLQNIGFDDFASTSPVIGVICAERTQAIQTQFERQRYSNRVLLTKAEINTPRKWAAKCKAHNIACFTWFSDTDEYGAHYLEDMLNGFKYTRARYITRNAWFDGTQFHDAPQHDYTQIMGGKARTLFAADSFTSQDFMALAPHESQALEGGYAIDPFELNEQGLLAQNRPQSLPAPVLSVITPVFNNGRFLRSKCLPSLQRNAIWPQIELILVDDGSTDGETTQIVRELAQEHANIRYYFYETGGSGSASRPRNKGIEMATAPLISFLDPDNEICPQGYDTLCALYEEACTAQGDGVDFVAGYHVKVAEQATAIGRHSAARLSLIEDLTGHFFARGKFPVIPTQSAVIARHLFDSPDLRFIERSAGQDTLFGWELLCQAKRGAFTDRAYLIYYAQRAESITNRIDRSYFEKKLILERAQQAMLERHGLLSDYLKHHYERFMQNWYLPKLAQVEDAQERAACQQILEEIAALYGREIPQQQAA